MNTKKLRRVFIKIDLQGLIVLLLSIGFSDLWRYSGIETKPIIYPLYM